MVDESEEWKNFLTNITNIEKNREFDRQVDRLKKSSSATTVWAVIPAIFGIYGIAHFYLNRPIEGLVILLVGMIPSIILFSLLSISLYYFYFPISNLILKNGFPDSVYVFIVIGFNLAFFIGNIISARYHYSRYDYYIHLKAEKPWNNWGLDSLI